MALSAGLAAIPPGGLSALGMGGQMPPGGPGGGMPGGPQGYNGGGEGMGNGGGGPGGGPMGGPNPNRAQADAQALQNLSKLSAAGRAGGGPGGGYSPTGARLWGQKIGSNDKFNEWKLFIGQVPLEVRGPNPYGCVSRVWGLQQWGRPEVWPAGGQDVAQQGPCMLTGGKLPLSSQLLSQLHCLPQDETSPCWSVVTHMHVRHQMSYHMSYQMADYHMARVIFCSVCRWQYAPKLVTSLLEPA